ncbi:PIF1-like helicase [Fragilaria crotonensis]|nr:PIF1-like helicase [Fragilaria crotonensis]
MVIPDFARNLISVGRLNENGNEFVSRKDESELKNPSGDTMKFEKETDGMTYLKARRVSFEREAFNAEGIAKRGDETIENEKNEAMDINEAHRKFGHATEKVVRSLLKTLGIKPTGEWAVCDGCARAKATQKRTNKITTTEAEERGERLYMDTSGPYNETVAGSRYWFKIVDDKTRKSWDFYGAKKSGIKRTFKNFWTN